MNASSEKKGNRNYLQSSFVIFKCAWLCRVRAFKHLELANGKLQVTLHIKGDYSMLESKLNMRKKYLAISNFTYFVLYMICPVLPV